MSWTLAKSDAPMQTVPSSARTGTLLGMLEPIRSLTRAPILKRILNLTLSQIPTAAASSTVGPMGGK
jgi:hypothetical protein